MISAKVKEFAYELLSLRRRYPTFVTSASATASMVGEVPVFVFHTIEPERFEQQLVYLVTNGYRTLSLEEFLAIGRGDLAATGRDVLLTIDDARSSVWRFGFPLLRRYNCKASVFAITGWTPDGPVRPNLDTIQSAGLRQSDLEALDVTDATVCTWEELRQMRASGLVDIESHTHLHRRLFTSSRLTGVVHARSVKTASDAVFSPYLTPAFDPTRLSPEHFSGYPLFDTRPLLAMPAAIGVAETAVGECVEIYRKYNESLPDPANAIKQAMIEMRRALPETAFRKVPPSEVQQAIREDLGASQAALRTHLGNATVGVHLCLPFTAGCEATVGIARELGFQSVLWGVDNERRNNMPGADPLRVVRLKNDFIWRLPGVGRRDLASIYLEKTSRRLAGVAPY